MVFKSVTEISVGVVGIGYGRLGEGGGKHTSIKMTICAISVI